ncbi:MAG: TIGR04222 domain-containing membrane protein, partial [Bradyrhizobium sp.]
MLLYVASALVLFGLSFLARQMIGPPVAIHPLNELELAYLSGGEQRLGEVVLLTLASKNAATFTPRNHRITITDQAPITSMVKQPTRLVFKPEMTWRQFQTTLAPLAEHIRHRLQNLGYYPTAIQTTAFRSLFLAVVGGLLLFGAIKVVVGAGRHHPVMVLVMLLAATCVAAVILLMRPMRTRAGNAALQRYQT